MRGKTDRQAAMLLGVDVEAFIPANHPIRRIRELTDQVLAELSPPADGDVFAHRAAIRAARTPDQGQSLDGPLLHPL
jgi:hypothetical protein